MEVKDEALEIVCELVTEKKIMALDKGVDTTAVRTLLFIQIYGGEFQPALFALTDLGFYALMDSDTTL